MVALAVEPMGRALECSGALTSWSVRSKVHQQGPTPQSKLGRTLMAVQAPACIHQPAQPVHRTIYRVARAMASRMGIGDHVGLRFFHNFVSISRTEVVQVCVAHHC
jgi:hypothetical protein